MIVVDTNVVSELMKAEPSARVESWARRHAARDLRLAAITVAEVLYGIGRLPRGRRKTAIRRAATDLFGRFAEQILPFDAHAAPYYAEIVDRRDRLSATISGYDAQIAAICRVHGATLATRNVKDFDRVGIDVVNPWTDR